MRKILIISLMLCLLMSLSNDSFAGVAKFSSLLSSTRVGTVKTSGAIKIPFITWGGDVATFYANGGLKTKKGSIFDKLGLNIELVPGDDFTKQVENYLAGKSPAIRGTFRMLGMASEVIGSYPSTKGHIVLQLTWSTGGDNLVVRKSIKNLNNIKGKKFVLQKGGPHVGMLDDILVSTGLSWDDIEVVWVKNLGSGPGVKDNTYPASAFRNKKDIDGAFVISPDVTGLTGGFGSTGSGAEGTVKGARVLMSTKEMARSIADMYCFRDDFYKSNYEWIEKFVAGYLKACEELVQFKKRYERSGSREYLKLLKLSQKIYGTDWFPALDDVHGLISDVSFVGYPGNVKFFTQKNNMNGFESIQKNALKMAVSQGYAESKCGFFPSGFDYSSSNFTKNISKRTAVKQNKFRAEALEKEIAALDSGQLDEDTLLSFTIQFKPNQNDFSLLTYGPEFKRVIELTSKFSGAVMTVRGHSDPTRTLLFLIKAGINKGIIKKTGSKNAGYNYYISGSQLKLTNTKKIISLIRSGKFDGDSKYNPREIMQSATNLSRNRAQAVIDSLIKYSKENNLTIDVSQITPVGVGIREPVIAKPKNLGEAKQNMRVEFRLIKVSGEVSNTSDFDF
ncbi:hypothetical protein KAJ27_01725 [bacterium]|nr:hypothetical protein [bacterium]